MSAIFSTVVIVVVHTPLWVWPLYALLLLLGFQRTRDSIAPLFRVLILPLVVMLLAILTFIAAGPSGLLPMLLGLVIGSMTGWQLERPGATRRLPDGRFWLRGEWLSLAQIIGVLVFRYAINVVPVLAPALRADLAWHVTTLVISAALSALFLGRTAARLRVYYGSPPVIAGFSQATFL